MRKGQGPTMRVLEGGRGERITGRTLVAEVAGLIDHRIDDVDPADPCVPHLESLRQLLNATLCERDPRSRG